MVLTMVTDMDTLKANFQRRNLGQYGYSYGYQQGSQYGYPRARSYVSFNRFHKRSADPEPEALADPEPEASAEPEPQYSYGYPYRYYNYRGYYPYQYRYYNRRW